MPQQQAYPIRCPQCDHRWTADLCDAFDAAKEPSLREALFRNQLNAVACPGCGFAFRVDKPLLYRDSARRLLIFWQPAPAGASTAAHEEQFTAWLREAGGLLPEDVNAPSVHLVFSRVELVERIFLCEAGLDERLVEYVKYLIYRRNGARVDPAAKLLLFNAQDSTEEQLLFVVQDEATRRFEATLQFSREAYRGLQEAFGEGEKAADLLELFPGPYISARALVLQEREQERREQQAEPPQEPGSSAGPAPQEPEG